MQTDLELQGRQHSLRFSSGSVHVVGEFAGNIDLRVEIRPALEIREVLDSLRIEIKESQEFIDISGYREDDGAWDLTLWSEHISDSGLAPETIDIYWRDKDQYLGEISCSQVASTQELPVDAAGPIYAHPWDDPKIRRQANIRGVAVMFFLLLFVVMVFYLLFKADS